jgi:hypothetical protein
MPDKDCLLFFLFAERALTNQLSCNFIIFNKKLRILFERKLEIMMKSIELIAAKVGQFEDNIPLWRDET